MDEILQDNDEHALLSIGSYNAWKYSDYTTLQEHRPGGSDARHRGHYTEGSLFPFNACVARPVGKKELESTAKAREAVKKEWDRLREIKTWDEDTVMEWADVVKLARQQGREKDVHVGRLIQLCTEKNSELEETDPARKYKGRVVFGGDKVKDANWEAAMFEELSSTPATMEASKACDAYGLMPGHDVMQADATQAYTQSKLGGAETWVRLPRDAWPDSWKNMKDPVCRLTLALYGHPDSGGYWEKHCEKQLRAAGFEPIQ